MLELFDFDKTSKLNILEYETLNELVGKNLKLTLELKRATEIPEKFSYKTKAMYNWLDADSTLFESKEVDKSKSPDFQYRGEHTIAITEELINHMMYNTLKIGIYGMIEGKRQPVQKRKSHANDDAESSEEEAKGEDKTPTFSRQTTSSATKARVQTAEERIKELER